MTEHKIQLCCLIIGDIYGEFLSHIFENIARFGRLPVGQIAQRCRMLQRQAKAGIGTLVQLRLVQHYSTDEGFSTYQVNLDNAYNLLRTGRLAELAHAKHGSTAATIIETLAANGFCTLKQLEHAVGEVLSQTNGHHGGQNGFHGNAKFRNALRGLVSDGFIGQIRPGHFHIPFDARSRAENAQGTFTAGGKKGEMERMQRAAKVSSQMERELDTHISVDDIETALDNPKEDHDAEQLYLCVNYSHVIKSVRDSTLSQHVSKTLGKSSSRLASAIMKQIPLSIPLDEPDPNTREDFQALAISTVQEDAQRLAHPRQTNGDHDTSMTNGVDGDEFDDREDLEDALLVLAQGPYPFLQRQEVTDQWTVDRYRLAAWLRDREIQRLVKARVDHTGLRLIRMLIDKGKLDEKLLQEIGLLNAKEMRQSLAELQTMGFIELQEVPREPQRQPSRTMYLWFFDAIRARDVLLGEMYKSMARLYQRLQAVERERTKATLEKIERDDVRGRVEEVVVGQEMVELQQFQAKERWIMAEIARLDESVILLKDL